MLLFTSSPLLNKVCVYVINKEFELAKEKLSNSLLVQSNQIFDRL